MLCGCKLRKYHALWLQIEEVYLSTSLYPSFGQKLKKLELCVEIMLWRLCCGDYVEM